jgi:hypothetical protein
VGLSGVQGLAPSRETGDTESLDHQIVNISIYCVVFASLSAVVGTLYPSPREAWNPEEVEVGILVFSCQVSGFVWFVVVLQRPGAGFVPGLVVVFVRSMG